MLGHKNNDTKAALATYISVLSPFSFAALRLSGRWLRPTA